ncbi:MAG: hypothetical protein RIS47_1569 [Bacteroidota bacterium]
MKKKLLLWYTLTYCVLFALPSFAGGGIFQAYVTFNTGTQNNYYHGYENADASPTALDGVNFGEIAPESFFMLKGAEVKTYKNGATNITGAILYYQVYESGAGDKGTVFEISLTNWENLTNPGDQKIFTNNAQLPIAQGLKAGNYVFECWIKVNNNETPYYSNNNNSGNNYRAYFKVVAKRTPALQWTPLFPQVTDALTLSFDKSLGNAGLAAASAPYYIHTGVNEWTHSSTWLDNATKYQLSLQSGNVYTLAMSDIRAYYGLGGSDPVSSIQAIFRNTDGSAQAKDYGSNDFRVPIYPAGLQMRLEAPSGTPMLSANQFLNIEASTNSGTQAKIYLDNVYKADATLVGNTASYALNVGTDLGLHTVKVEINDGTTTIFKTFDYFVRGSQVEETTPVGLKNGVNYINDNSVTLVLWAPFKKDVYLIGDFNDWKPTEAYRMKYDATAQNFWLNLTGLVKGQEYGYQYLIDGNLRIADAYTNKVLDQWNDPDIPAAVYPNLKAYPAGKTSDIVSVFQTAKPSFPWKVTTFTPSAIGATQPDLTIYELHIRDFTNDGGIGTIRDAMAKLDYLQSLGINAIELMPINEFEGNNSWGYNPSFYFAPDKAYGTEADYKAFIDECHLRGIAVIIDMVLNHSFGQSPMVRMYFDNFGSWGAPSAENPWFNRTSPNTSYSWGADFNHESQATKNFIDQVASFWLTEYKVDGFRYDFTKGFTNVGGDGYAYDASRIAILKRMYDHIKSVNTNAYVILEHLTDQGEEKELMNYGMMVWTTEPNRRFMDAMKGYDTDNHFLSSVSYKTRGANTPTYPNLVTFMESHDEERIMYPALTYGNNDGGLYDIKNLNTALKRAEASAAFFLSVPGPKMIWEFGELGYGTSIDYPSRTGFKPVHWDYYDNPERRKVFNTYALLNNLRQHYPAFRTSDFNIWEAPDGDGNEGAKSIRLRIDGTDVVVLTNFSVYPKYCNPQWEEQGTWYDLFANNTYNVDGGNIGNWIQLQPGEYRIYSYGAALDASLATWQGTTTDWHTATNWNTGKVPATNTNVLVSALGNTVFPKIGTTTTINDLQIGEHASVEIQNAATLTAHNLSVKASDASVGMILDKSTTGNLSLTGTATVEYTIKPNKWVNIGTPTNLTNIPATLISSGYLKRYDESTSAWKYLKSTDVFEAGRGYNFWLNKDQTLKFTGQLLTGNISYNLTRTATTGNGWNQLANPYLSAIEWTATDWGTDPNLPTSYYLWDDAAGNYGTYNHTLGAGTGTLSANGFIPPMHTFFVQATQNATIEFHNANRTTQLSTSKKTEPIGILRLRVRTNKGADELILANNPLTTLNYEPQADILKLRAETPDVSLIQTVGTKEYAAQSFDLASTNSLEISLFSTETRSLTLQFLGTDNFLGVHELTVENPTTGTFTPIYGNADYTVSLQAAQSQKLILHFSKKSLAVETTENQTQIYATSGNIYIRQLGTENAMQLHVYDLMGRELLHQNLPSSALNKIPAPAKGILLIQTRTETQTNTQKIFVE